MDVRCSGRVARLRLPFRLWVGLSPTTLVAERRLDPGGYRPRRWLAIRVGEARSLGSPSPIGRQARVAADSFELGDLQFHSSVAQGRKLMPCATTPAPTDEGRQNLETPTLGGRKGGRQFAPWHYTVEAMLQDSQGRLHLPPPDVKEQLHHIPVGYTAKAGADTKTRHRRGVAARLLGILVMATWAKPGRAPAAPPRQGTIPWLSQVWSRRGWDFSPPPRPTPALLGGLGEDAHWAAASGMQHSLVGWPQLEPALEAVIRFRRHPRQGAPGAPGDGRRGRGGHDRLAVHPAPACAGDLRDE